jgi:hypothetical protein
MPLIKYSIQQQIEILENKIHKLKQQNIKDWQLVIIRYYQIKKLKKQIKELKKQ